jgi:hypothetical protein
LGKKIKSRTLGEDAIMKESEVRRGKMVSVRNRKILGTCKKLEEGPLKSSIFISQI